MDQSVRDLILESFNDNLKTSKLSTLTKQDELQFTPLSGFLNHVCRVTSQDGNTGCVVKVYLPYPKFQGEETELEKERSQREYEANKYLSQISNCVCSEIYYHDSTRNIVCMQDLKDHHLWLDFLLKSCDLKIGAKIADVLVDIHAQTHTLQIEQAKFEEQRSKFSKLPKYTTFTKNCHFIKPFSPEHRNNKPANEEVRQKLDEIIKDEVVTKAVSLVIQCLDEEYHCCIHGDAHAGAFMVNPDTGDLKIIDTESFRVGPEAYDIALLVSNYILVYHYHQELSQQPSVVETKGPDHNDLRINTLDLICITLSRYMEGMSRRLGKEFDKQNVWKQTLLYTAVWIIAWISGPADMECLKDHPDAQINALNTALRILHKQSLSLDTQDISKLIHNQS